jgi:hypothetical protein
VQSALLSRCALVVAWALAVFSKSCNLPHTNLGRPANHAGRPFFILLRYCLP